jgi:hypothetical protein
MCAESASQNPMFAATRIGRLSGYLYIIPTRGCALLSLVWQHAIPGDVSLMLPQCKDLHAADGCVETVMHTFALPALTSHGGPHERQKHWRVHHVALGSNNT